MSSSATKTEAKQTGARAQKKIAVIGCGKMGSILLQAFLERKLVSAEEVAATVQHEEKSRTLSGGLGSAALDADNRTAEARAPVVLVWVKPLGVAQVLKEIAPVVS